MIKSYTLDCGCYFEHRVREGHKGSYELVSACSLHNALSSEPPVHTLPPVPFLSVPQAGGPSRWITAPDGVGVVPADPNHTLCELPQVQTNSRFEAKVDARVDEAMEHLEHTQPIIRPDQFLPVTRQEFELLKQAVNNIEARLPTPER